MDEQMASDLKHAIWLAEHDDRGRAKVDPADLVSELATLGYAVVKLPEVVVNQDGYETWPVASSDADACVKIRRSDDRLSMDGVSTPFASPERALSAAVALIAAAWYKQEKNGE